MCLMYQLLTGPVIEFSIHVIFPLAEELQRIPASHPALNDIPRRIFCVLFCYFCQRNHSSTNHGSHIALHNFNLTSNLLGCPQLFFIQRIVKGLSVIVCKVFIYQSLPKKPINRRLIMECNAYV